MYKITTVVPNREMQVPNEWGDLTPIDIEGTTTLITTVREGDDALRLIVGFCKMIAAGDKVKSLTITKCNDNHKQTEE